MRLAVSFKFESETITRMHSSDHKVPTFNLTGELHEHHPYPLMPVCRMRGRQLRLRLQGEIHAVDHGSYKPGVRLRLELRL
jgi:hypothetical protein